VNTNLANGAIDLKQTQLTYDTTHFIAYSQMQTVEVLPPRQPQAVVPLKLAGSLKPRRKALQRRDRKARSKARAKVRAAWKRSRRIKRGKPAGELVDGTTTKKKRSRSRAKKQTKLKSHPKTIKRCRCKERTACPHPWVSADPGAATVVKSRRAGQNRQYWAHKAAVLGTGGPRGVPLDAVAMTDGASHDSTALVPQLERVFLAHPILRNKFDTILADMAMDDLELKDAVEEHFGLILRTPINPRNRRPIIKDLPRGMKTLSPSGGLICKADREMSYRGVRFKSEEFLYGPPRTEAAKAACTACPLRLQCCQSSAAKGRHVAIPFDRLPHIDPGDPPMGKRFKALIRHRTAVERSIKRLKLDFGDPQLKRRGTASFQAHLDRSMIALHLSLRE
jgi:hypothetical protein